MAVQFVVDSASDILPEEARRLGIYHLSLRVIFGKDEYRDGIEITHKEFYEKLIESDTLPTTSQLAPADYAPLFEQIVADGDTAVVVSVSGRLSGTYQSAVIAAEEYPDRIFVVDSENVTLGQRILLMRGLELRDEGLSAREIAEKLDEEKGKIRLLALLDTLEYLKKGGRISAATALAGGLLSIKPVVAVEEGEVRLIGKARGSKQGNNLLRQLVDKCGGIDFGRPYCLAYSGLTDTLLQKYIADSWELWHPYAKNLPIATVGGVIGTHAGPGAVAVAFFAK